MATLKLSPPVPLGTPIAINLGAVRNGTVTLGNVNLAECIQFAYLMPSAKQVVGPEWIYSRDERFDIVGKASPDTSRDDLRVMTRNLLAERLKLSLHREKKDLPFLALVVARNGLKITPSSENENNPTTIPGRILAKRMAMPIFVMLLSRFEREMILDMTDLNGFFAIDLQWLTDDLRRRAPQDGTPLILNGEAVDLNRPSLSTALQEQLGLRLESRKGPIDVLVVDHAEKTPADN